MRLHEFITESKNVIFADTASYDPAGPVPAQIHKFVTKLLKPLKFSTDSMGNTVTPVGSAFQPRLGADGKTKPSNDWDGQIDLDDVMKAFPADLSHLSDKKQATLESNPAEKQKELVKQSKQLFLQWLKDRGLEAKLTGITAHIRVPIGDKFYQADLEMVRNRSDVSQFHQHQIPPGSQYKGVHKHVFLRALAKSQNKLWSPWEGLFNRNAEGTKTNLISSNPKKIAQSLFGPEADARTLDNLENMLAALPHNKATEILDLARQDPSWGELS
jgi:hypothetical protein